VRGLHNLRIAAKRLHHTLEIFEDALPSACQAIAHELAQVQDELGALHDSDVMIALLRLCMGGEDAGIAYEQALVKAGKQKGKGKLLLQPALVASVLDPDVAHSLSSVMDLSSCCTSSYSCVKNITGFFASIGTSCRLVISDVSFNMLMQQLAECGVSLSD
jgi:hypothetical protein